MDIIPTKIDLPGLNCGTCGFRRCDDLAARLPEDPELIKRCIYLSPHTSAAQTSQQTDSHTPDSKLEQKQNAVFAPTLAGRDQTAPCGTRDRSALMQQKSSELAWRDSLGREFDFYLEHFPEDPGPREIIIPHNPMLTREMAIKPGDTLIGRPLGMSCGCPITHCGVAMEVDERTGVIVWCVTGPLTPRQNGFKDLGYYIAEGYEGLIRNARSDIKIGMRYFFQPQMCMLQWRHSGLVNYLNRNADNTLQVRVEGLWIG